MKLSTATLLIVAAVFTVAVAKERNNKPYKVVCYYQPGYPAEEINLNICTHINYAFSILVNGSIHLGSPGHDVGPQGMIPRTIALRKYNPHLTIMISLGGWGEGSTKYSEMVRTAAGRGVFVKSVVDFIAKYDFDGVDLDWEYPGWSGNGGDDRTVGRAQDKADYITLLKELRAAFKPHDYLLTAAIAAGKTEIDRAYELAEVSKNLDFLNVMSYDYQGAWSYVTAHHSALYPDPKQTQKNQELTIQFTIDYFIKNGVDPKKIILGLPIYGHIYHLAGADHGVWAKVNGTGREQRAYNKLCVEFKNDPGWNFEFDPIAKVPYAYNNQTNVWVSYDNLKSFDIKLKYIIEKKLGGSMVWSLDLDDTKNECGDGKFAMMKVQMKTLNKIEPSDVYPPKHH